MAQEKNNMRIWDEVCETDPSHTKPVEFGRKFTAIDAHYQIMTATQTFGPCGEGWGFVSGQPVFPPNDTIIIPVSIWHGSRDNIFGPIYGCADLKKTNGKPDNDAPKKATTDALTKGLAHLGFNADVFLGKFDDNKYVAEMREKAEAKLPPAPEIAKRDEIIAAIKVAADPMEVIEKHKTWLGQLKKTDPASANMVARAANDRVLETTEKEAT